jgi:hypothetical protein
MNKSSHAYLLLSLLILPLLASAAELSLSIGDFSTSANRRRVYLEGQQAQLSVRVIRGGGEKYLGLPYYPPYSLKIVAGTQSSQGFIENTLWTRQLALQHYVDRYRVRADSLYKTKGTPVDVDGDQTNLGEFYQFCFTVPDAPSNGKVCLKVVYEQSEFGHLESEAQCLSVVRTRSEDDTRILWASMINAAYARSDARRVIALADSFIALGFVDPDWTDVAKTIAYESGNYRKALEYLDANYEVNGITSASQLGEWGGQRVNISERRQKDYDRQRKDLLAKIGGK